LSAAHFDKSYFGDVLRFGETWFETATFAACIPKEVVVFDQCDLEEAPFFNTPIESMSFINCRWKQGKNRHVICDDTEKKYDDRQARVEHHRRLEDTYRRLKKTAKRDNDELMASDWHWQEKEHMRRKLALEKGRWGKLKSLWVPASLYKFVSGYGESPGRAFWVLLGAVALPFFILGAAKLAETGVHASVDWTAMREVGKDWLRSFPIFKPPMAWVEPPLWKSALSLVSQILITLQAAFFGLAWRNKFRR
jgi:hypothetical protein